MSPAARSPPATCSPSPASTPWCSRAPRCRPRRPAARWRRCTSSRRPSCRSGRARPARRTWPEAGAQAQVGARARLPPRRAGTCNACLYASRPAGPKAQGQGRGQGTVPRPSASTCQFGACQKPVGHSDACKAPSCRPPPPRPSASPHPPTTPTYSDIYTLTHLPSALCRRAIGWVDWVDWIGPRLRSSRPTLETCRSWCAAFSCLTGPTRLSRCEGSWVRLHRGPGAAPCAHYVCRQPGYGSVLGGYGEFVGNSWCVQCGTGRRCACARAFGTPGSGGRGHMPPGNAPHRRPHLCSQPHASHMDACPYHPTATPLLPSPGTSIHNPRPLPRQATALGSGEHVLGGCRASCRKSKLLPKPLPKPDPLAAPLRLARPGR